MVEVLVHSKSGFINSGQVAGYKKMLEMVFTEEISVEMLRHFLSDSEMDKLEENPSFSNVAKAFKFLPAGFDNESVELMVTCANNPSITLLSEPIPEMKEEVTLEETVPDKNHDIILDIENQILREEIEGVLKNFSEKRRYVIIRRFGLDGGKSCTLQEIGNELGVTRERIRQIEKEALGYFRRSQKLASLFEYYKE
jgi:RNA polymerase sigma factor (sigma-70 family)